MGEKLEVVAKYGIDIDTLDFSIEDFTVEELVEKFEAMKSAADKHEEKFTLTSGLIEELERAISVVKTKRDWGECDRYYYVDCDIESWEVYCWDRDDWTLWGFKFSMDGDSVKIDFDSKKRKKYTIADFEGGEQEQPSSSVFKHIEQEMADYADIKSKYAEASSTITSMQDELGRLRDFKAQTENAIIQAKREEMFAQFEDLAGIEAFEALKADCDSYDIDTLEEKCFAIRGKYGVVAKFSSGGKQPRIKVPKIDKSNEPYGGLFLKYANDGSN